MQREQIKALDNEYIVHTYARADLVADSGKGAILKDMDGRELIDFTSGIGVNALGFCDDAWMKAITEQLEKVQHISNLYYTQPAPRLAEMMCKRTGMKRAFFCNSGAESNECAIKVARKYGNDKKKGKNKIVTLIDSFHGRTIQTLTATGQEDMHIHFAPFSDGFSYVASGDIESMKRAVTDETCAVMMELIQGEGGVNVMEQDFVTGVAEICKEHDALLVIDEVQTGVGRTGKLFCYEHYGIEPDLVSFAKGIGGGLPLGGVLFNEKTKDVLEPGQHGTTFGANPVICAGAIAVMERLDDAFLADIERKGEKIKTKLRTIEGVKDVDGMGLMIGFNIEGIEPADVVDACLKKGLITLTAHGKVRLLPPYVITDEEIEKGIEIISQVS